MRPSEPRRWADGGTPCARSSVDRALPSGGRGHRFESCRARHLIKEYRGPGDVPGFLCPILPRHPRLAPPSGNRHIRIIDTWGPSPIPPWVIHKDVSQDVGNAIRRTLLQMHSDSRGRQILDQGQIDHFIQVEDRDYDPVREMAEIAASVPLSHPEP